MKKIVKPMATITTIKIRITMTTATIINIDESVLRVTEHRKRSWMKRGKRNLTTNYERLPNVNIIAAVSNSNKFFFSVNRGQTTSQTFWYFLLRLCMELTKQDPNWRDDTVIMIDNASYHRSIIIKEKI